MFQESVFLNFFLQQYSTMNIFKWKLRKRSVLYAYDAQYNWRSPPCGLCRADILSPGSLLAVRLSAFLHVSQPLEISTCFQCRFKLTVLPSIIVCDIQVHKELQKTTLFTPESPAITFTLPHPHWNGQILRDRPFSLFPQHYSSLWSLKFMRHIHVCHV